MLFSEDILLGNIHLGRAQTTVFLPVCLTFGKNTGYHAYPSYVITQ